MTEAEPSDIFDFPCACESVLGNGVRCDTHKKAYDVSVDSPPFKKRKKTLDTVIAATHEMVGRQMTGCKTKLEAAIMNSLKGIVFCRRNMSDSCFDYCNIPINAALVFLGLQKPAAPKEAKEAEGESSESASSDSKKKVKETKKANAKKRKGEELKLGHDIADMEQLSSLDEVLTVDRKVIVGKTAKNTYFLREAFEACAVKPVEGYENMLSWIGIEELLCCLKRQSTERGLEAYEKTIKEQCVQMTALANYLKSMTQDLYWVKKVEERTDMKRADEVLEARLSNMNSTDRAAHRAAHMLQVRQGKFAAAAVEAPTECASLEAGGQK